MLAKAVVGQPLSFHHTLSQHRDVLESMSAHEAQQLFSAAMSHLTQHFHDDMLALAKVAWQVAACSELGFGAGGQLAAEQLQQLVEVHLSCGQTQQAFTVRAFADVWLSTKHVQRLLLVSAMVDIGMMGKHACVVLYCSRV